MLNLPHSSNAGRKILKKGLYFMILDELLDFFYDAHVTDGGKNLASLDVGKFSAEIFFKERPQACFAGTVEFDGKTSGTYTLSWNENGKRETLPFNFTRLE